MYKDLRPGNFITLDIGRMDQNNYECQDFLDEFNRFHVGSSWPVFTVICIHQASTGERWMIIRPECKNDQCFAGSYCGDIESECRDSEAYSAGLSAIKTWWVGPDMEPYVEKLAYGADGERIQPISEPQEEEVWRPLAERREEMMRNGWETVFVPDKQLECSMQNGFGNGRCSCGFHLAGKKKNDGWV